MRYLVTALLLFLMGCATPVTGEKSFFKGAIDTEVAESTHLITVKLNEFTAPAALKPSVLRRAKIIAETKGYKSFEIQRYIIWYDPRWEGFATETLVKFSRDSDQLIRGRKYLTTSDELTAYKEKLTPDETQLLAKLSGSKIKDESGKSIFLTPAYIDAVASEISFFTGTSFAFITPGSIEFTVYASVREGLFGSSKIVLLPLRVNLESGKSYVLAGRVVNNLIEYWLEEENTKTPVTKVDMRPLPGN
jgi:hypothetical protein